MPAPVPAIEPKFPKVVVAGTGAGPVVLIVVVAAVGVALAGGATGVTPRFATVVSANATAFGELVARVEKPGSLNTFCNASAIC